MKSHHILTLLVASAFLHYSSSSCLAQGSLTPPAGPPAPTMKTLDQVEARTPVNDTSCPGNASAVHVISQPGSYYLTGNINGVLNKDGIIIASANVVLDLNGFALIGAGGASWGSGIDFAVGAKSVTVRNGSIAKWGSFGITYGPPSALYENLTVRECGHNEPGVGALGGGIAVTDATTLKDCRLEENITGVWCTGAGVSIVRCCAHKNEGDGFIVAGSAALTECSAIENDTGFNLSGSSTISNCTAIDNRKDGFSGGGVFNSCTAAGNQEFGFEFSAGTVLKGCQAASNKKSGFGAVADGAGCILESCVALTNVESGIVTDDESRVIGCTVTSNGTNGIKCGNGCLIQDCNASHNKTDGIQAIGKCVVRGSIASKNGTAGSGAGIHCTSGGNRIEGNETRENLGHGIKADAGPAGDFIFSNTAFGNPVNYSPSTGSTFAPIQPVATQTHPTANH